MSPSDDNNIHNSHTKKGRINAPFYCPKILNPRRQNVLWAMQDSNLRHPAGKEGSLSSINHPNRLIVVDL